jgi:hypothetical protein
MKKTKLSLSRTTVRRLDDAGLRDAAGALMFHPPPTTISVAGCPSANETLCFTRLCTNNCPTRACSRDC